MIRYGSLSDYINIGTQEQLSDYENRRIKFTNIVALSIMIACLAGIGLSLTGLYLYAHEGSIIQGTIPLLQMFIIFIVLHLNRKHEYYSAKLLLVLSSIVTIILMGLFFQPESGNNLFFILGPLGIFLFLGLNNYAYMLVFFSFLLTLSVLAYQFIYPPIAPIADVLLETTYIVSVMVVFSLVALMTFFLIQTNQKMEKKLISTMETDTLTGLYNRLKYDTFLAESIKSLSAQKKILSIILIDIDFFKLYNDTYGHHKGDQTLIAIASILKSFNAYDTLVARFGGEEFILILKDQNKDAAIAVAENILEKVRDIAIPHSSSPISDIVTCSAGIASSIPKEEEKTSKLFEEADSKLYLAKKSGRDRISF